MRQILIAGAFALMFSLFGTRVLIRLLAKKGYGQIIRDDGPKSVKTQIQGETLRVTSKSRDDLQTTMALVKEQKLDFAVQFTNYR